VNNIYKWVYI